MKKYFYPILKFVGTFNDFSQENIIQINKHSDIALTGNFMSSVLILAISAFLHSYFNTVYYAELMKDLSAFAITCGSCTLQFPHFSDPRINKP